MLLSVLECSTLNRPTIPSHYSGHYGFCVGTQLCSVVPDDIVPKMLLSVLECSILNRLTIRQRTRTGTRMRTLAPKLWEVGLVPLLLEPNLLVVLGLKD